MVELPAPGPEETLPAYINRLITTGIITASQIPFAIMKFNKK